MINSDIEVVGIYVNSATKILHRCKIDGYEWNSIPNNILHGQGCPRCAGVERYTQEEYVKKVGKINPNIEVVGEYFNAYTPIIHRCKIDEYEWNVVPYSILRGGGCPKCNASRGEKIISAWLNGVGILYEPQKMFHNCKHERVLPFDFYLTDYNICIEYNGIQHYEPVDYFGGEESFKIRVLRDKIKADYCKEHNIPLVIIPYWADINEELEKLHELIKSQELIKEVAT